MFRKTLIFCLLLGFGYLPGASATQITCKSVLSVHKKSALSLVLNRYQNTRSKLPKFFFDPIPRLVGGVDQNLIDSKVEDFVTRLKNKEISEGGLLDELQTNEDRISYLEAREILLREYRTDMSDAGYIKFLRKKRTKALIQAVSRWPKGEVLNKDAYLKVMDLIYLNGQSVSINSGENLSGLKKLARLRWEGQLYGKSLKAYISEGGVSGLFKARRYFYWASVLGVNFLNIRAIYFPGFYPRFSLFDYPKVKKNFDRFFEGNILEVGDQEELSKQFSLVFKFEHYNRWINRIFPYVVGAALFINVWPELADLINTSYGTDLSQSFSSEFKNQLLEIVSAEYQDEFGIVPDREALVFINEKLFQITEGARLEL